MPFAAGKVRKPNVFLSETREGLHHLERTPFFRLGLYGIQSCVAETMLVHGAVEEYLPPEWVGGGRMPAGYD